MSAFGFDRRQAFMGARFYRAMFTHRLKLLADLQHELQGDDVDDEGRSLLCGSLADERFELLGKVCRTGPQFA